MQLQTWVYDSGTEDYEVHCIGCYPAIARNGQERIKKIHNKTNKIK